MQRAHPGLGSHDAEGRSRPVRRGRRAAYLTEVDATVDLTHFRDDPAVLGYDVFNESEDATAPTATEFDRKLECFYGGSGGDAASCAATAPPTHLTGSGVIGAIQAVDPTHVVFVEPPVLADYGVPSTTGLSLPFADLALSFHAYGVTGALA